MPETRTIGEILRDSAAGRLENILAESRKPYDLIGSAERLFNLLEGRGIEFIVVGGIAMLQYVEGRNTRDVDLIVHPSATHQIPELVVLSEDQDFARADFHGVLLDFLKTSNPVFEEVRSNHSALLRFGNRDVRVATPFGLFLLKCYALPSLYRQGEFRRADLYEDDLLGLLRGFEIDEEAAFARLAPHMLATDIASIRDIVRDIRSRLAKSFERGRPSIVKPAPD